MDLKQALENFGSPQQIAALHLVGVFFKAHLPVGVDLAATVGEERKDARDFAVFRYPSEPDIGRIGKRNQYGHAVASEAQEVKLFKSAPKIASADILDGPNTLVGIDDF